jgi:hypothetical protein
MSPERQAAIEAVRQWCRTQKTPLDYDRIEARLHFSTGNAKLKKSGIVGFKMPPIATCSGFGRCAHFCFARVGHFLLPDVARIMVASFKFSLREDFSEITSAAIRAQGIARVRVDEAGDFYDLEYLIDWCVIARENPRTRFYAYTKSLPIAHAAIDAGLVPKNFVIVQSEGGRFDHLIRDDLPVARIFKDKEELKRAKFTDTSENDVPALEGKRKIGLIAHGARKNNVFRTQNTQETSK